jgi:hypothetical protein
MRTKWLIARNTTEAGQGDGKGCTFEQPDVSLLGDEKDVRLRPTAANRITVALLE